jgi:hypothetical protein
MAPTPVPDVLVYPEVETLARLPTATLADFEDAEFKQLFEEEFTLGIADQAGVHPDNVTVTGYMSSEEGEARAQTMRAAGVSVKRRVEQQATGHGDWGRRLLAHDGVVVQFKVVFPPVLTNATVMDTVELEEADDYVSAIMLNPIVPDFSPDMLQRVGTVAIITESVVQTDTKVILYPPPSPPSPPPPPPPPRFPPPPPRPLAPFREPAVGKLFARVTAVLIFTSPDMTSFLADELAFDSFLAEVSATLPTPLNLLLVRCVPHSLFL